MMRKQRGGAIAVALIMLILVRSSYSSSTEDLSAQESAQQKAESLYRNSVYDVTNFISSEVSRDASFCIVNP